MKLTPLEIKKQEFQKTLRGYDQVEVEAFLEMVSDEFESVIREKNLLSDEVIKLKTQLTDYQTVEKTLQETLVSAQESMKESRKNSSREAELVVKESELKAEKILEDAKLKLAEMKNELVLIKAQKDSFARRLRHLLESQLELIEVLELDDLGFEKYSPRKNRVVEQKRNIEEKVEFKAIDDDFSRNPQTAKIYKEPVKPDSLNELGWGKKRPEEKNVEGDDKTEDKKRISDQLIF